MDKNNVLVNCYQTKITHTDITRLEEMCYESTRREELYKMRNDAKLRAVYTTANYDEFK